MPRANRTFVPGHVWHLTHRCHKKEFLLKFARDRRCWLLWLFEAKRRYGLCVLNYIITSNHIHLLVMDTGADVIPQSMQLVAAQTAQRYNKRKNRKGAYWEDRYHATAVQTDGHLRRCMTYIDLNMVRAGVVTHPADWLHSGFSEIQAPPQRYSKIDLRALCRVSGFENIPALQAALRSWVETALIEKQFEREARGTEAPVVGDEDFVDEFEASHEMCHLEIGEPSISYSVENDPENSILSRQNCGFGIGNRSEIRDF